MIPLPSAFEERMKAMLKEEYSFFLQTLQSESPVSIRLNPLKQKSGLPDFLAPFISHPVEWCGQAFYLNKRPVFTLDPCFHGGAYYVQEASSMFLAYILKKIMPEGSLRVLDLCAAPGGKSTLLASALSPDSLLVSNEVIRSRAGILKENMIKWGQDNIVVTNSDPSNFSELEESFDIILVDAPCSGEGMFRKDDKAIEDWSENNIKLCSERQKRILSDIWDSLKPGGYLIYSTCTYNREENENVLEWLVREFKAQSVPVEHSFEGITSAASTIAGYHFFPYRTVGEGFFIGAVRKDTTGSERVKRKKNGKQKSEKSLVLPSEIQELIYNNKKFTVYNNENGIGIFPEIHRDFIKELETCTRVIYKGCELAEINNRKIKLLPPLAFYAGLIHENCCKYDADTCTALTFLKKEDIPVTAPAGEWVLITHRDTGLGWGKSLGSRLNNYYPKEWRIRMDINRPKDESF